MPGPDDLHAGRLLCWGRKPGRDQREEKRQAVHEDTPLALSAWATSETPHGCGEDIIQRIFERKIALPCT